LFKQGERSGSGWAPAKSEHISRQYPLNCPLDRISALAATATRLAATNDTLQERLINSAMQSATCRYDASSPKI